MPLTDPGLGDTLTALPKGSTAQVVVTFTLGTLYHLRRIDIDGEVPAPINAAETLGLKTGQPAVAAVVLAGGSRLLSALQEQGYAFAQVDPPIAYEAADAPVLDLNFHVIAGVKVNIGEIHIEGLQRVHESLVRRRLLLHTGDVYKPSAIEAARRDLLALNVFGQVSVQTGSAADASGGVPVVVSPHVNLAPEIEEAGAGWVGPLKRGALEHTLAEIMRDAQARSRRGAAGRELVHRRFTWSAVAEQLVAVYTRAALTRRRGWVSTVLVKGDKLSDAGSS